jgi:hypothetical protein
MCPSLGCMQGPYHPRWLPKRRARGPPAARFDKEGLTVPKVTPIGHELAQVVLVGRRLGSSRPIRAHLSAGVEQGDWRALDALVNRVYGKPKETIASGQPQERATSAVSSTSCRWRSSRPSQDMVFLKPSARRRSPSNYGASAPRTGAPGFAGSTLKQRLIRTTRRRQWLSLKVCARPSTSQGRAPIEQPISPRLTADE